MKKLFALSAFALASVAAQAHITQFAGNFVTEGGGGRTGGGTLFLEYDEDGRTLLVDATFAGLSGTTTQSHFHCCTAAANTGNAGVAVAQQPQNNLPNFTLGVKEGHYVQIINLASTSSYTATFLTANGGTTLGAETAFIAALGAGKSYMNIHTTTFGSGEIRALVTMVPEPGTWAMMAMGLAAVGGLARRRTARA